MCGYAIDGIFVHFFEGAKAFSRLQKNEQKSSHSDELHLDFRLPFHYA